jgi:hypothetical protein
MPSFFNEIVAWNSLMAPQTSKKDRQIFGLPALFVWLVPLVATAKMSMEKAAVTLTKLEQTTFL